MRAKLLLRLQQWEHNTHKTACNTAKLLYNVTHTTVLQHNTKEIKMICTVTVTVTVYLQFPAVVLHCTNESQTANTAEVADGVELDTS